MQRLLPLLLLSSTAFAQQLVEPAVAAAWRDFQQTQGGAFTAEWNPATGTPRAIFGDGLPLGAPVEDVATARTHASRVLAQHRALLGLGSSELVEITGEKAGRLFYFVYQQRHQGLEVLDARADVRIHETGAVSMFGSTAVPIPADFATRPAITAAAARAVAETHLFGVPGEHGPAPRLVIWAQPEAPAKTTPVLAFEVPVDTRPAALHVGRVYVDAARSVVLEYRDDVHACSVCNTTRVSTSRNAARLHASLHRAEALRAPAAPAVALTGTVLAWTNTGLLPTDALQNIPLRNVLVTSSAGNAYTDAQGNFSIPYTGTAAVSVAATLTGRHSRQIRVAAGTQLTASVPITPGTPGTLQFGSAAMVENDRSQTTTYHFVDDINEWCRAILPAQTSQMNVLSGMNPQVNILASCNAYYTGYTINFYQQSSTCNMTAFSTVIIHEWGHGFDDAFGGIQRTDGLSEGWADVVALLRTQQPVMGQSFFKTGAFVRSGLNTRTYPVASTSVHAQGEVWMGWVWDVRTDLVASLGQTAGERRSIDIVIPTIVANAANMTAQIREVFLADDNDGNLNNGTPNYTSLEKASLKRTVTYPVRVNPNAGTYVSYGAGCPGSGTKAGTGCLRMNDTGTPQALTTRPNVSYAIRATAPANLDVVGFELYTSAAVNLPVYLWSATTAGVPDQVLATGTMSVGATAQWYRATFPATVKIAQGQQFFVGFQNGTTTIAASIRTGTETPYFRNDGPSGAWNGPLTGFPWAFIVNCQGGTGAIPALSNAGVPELGTSFRIDLSGANPSAQGFLIVGASDTTWSGGGLPFDLTKNGAPGCFLLASVDVLLGVSTDALGRASQTIPVPNVPAYFGAPFFNQFAIGDAANAFGIVLSNGGKAKVGKQ